MNFDASHSRCRVALAMFTLLLASALEAADLRYNDVAPILLGRCVMCHVPNGMMGDAPEGYRLDTYEQTISRGDRVRVVPGNALASELYRRIAGHARPRMPFNGPPYLSDEEIAKIGLWIDQGARDNDGNTAPSVAGARIRLHGKLTARWELDGLPVNVGPGTRLKKSPGVGRYVRVRGAVSADGKSVNAERIESK